MKNGRKICAALLIGGAIASAGMFAGCAGPKDDTEMFANTSDVYGFAGATTAMLASDDTIGQAMAGANTAGTPLNDLIQNAIQATLDNYMNVFDAVVGGTKPVETLEVESDDVNYKHKMNITMTSIEGEAKTFTLYFNETLAEDDEVDVEDSDDEERETKLDGKLVAGDLTFYVVGEKEVEDDEVEVSFKASLTKGDTQNYVKFSQEHSVENGKVEEEYNFEIYLLGQSVAEFAFDMEKGESGTIEVEYEQEVTSLSGEKKTISFEISKIDENKISIKTDDFLGISLEINVTAVASGDQLKYVYSIPTLGLSFDGGLKIV